MAALEDYEQIIATRLTYFPPQVPRYTHLDYQRIYGQALASGSSAARRGSRLQRYHRDVARYQGHIHAAPGHRGRAGPGSLRIARQPVLTAPLD